MPTICPQEAKRIAVAALLHGQVPISTIARTMINAVKRHLESGDPSDSLSSVEAEACKTPYSSRETLKAAIKDCSSLAKKVTYVPFAYFRHLAS